LFTTTDVVVALEKGRAATFVVDVAEAFDLASPAFEPPDPQLAVTNSKPAMDASVAKPGRR
jgi:hypothetical protein